MDRILHQDETVIWRSKPEKKAYILPAFGGVPFALFFSIFLYLMITIGKPSGEQWSLPIMLSVWIIGLIIVPPVWKFRKLPNIEYLITNQRLLIKSGDSENDLWFTGLGRIKETIVKIGIGDKIMGTGKIFPITPEYPYAPKLRAYSRGGMYNLKKVFNIVEGKDEEVTEIELYRRSISHPRLEGLKEPYRVQELLKDAIFRARAN
jgi:hypothetical protein